MAFDTALGIQIHWANLPVARIPSSRQMRRVRTAETVVQLHAPIVGDTLRTDNSGRFAIAKQGAYVAASVGLLQDVTYLLLSFYPRAAYNGCSANSIPT